MSTLIIPETDFSIGTHAQHVIFMCSVIVNIVNWSGGLCRPDMVAMVPLLLVSTLVAF